jgi:Family of unknown function (DUF6191)
VPAARGPRDFRDEVAAGRHRDGEGAGDTERMKGPVRWTSVAVVFFMTIPGLAVGLILLAALDRAGLWLHDRSGLPWYRNGHRPAHAAGLDELQAVFQSGTRHAIERRRAELVLRDDEHDGAPPLVRVDLDKGHVLITRPSRSPSAGA